MEHLNSWNFPAMNCPVKGKEKCTFDDGLDIALGRVDIVQGHQQLRRRHGACEVGRGFDWKTRPQRDSVSTLIRAEFCKLRAQAA